MSSSQEQKINDLLVKLRQDNRPSSMSRQPTSPQNNGDMPTNRPSLTLNMNTQGSTRRRPQELSFSPRNNDNSETDKKLREIMKISGRLTINNVVYNTDIKDMEHLEVLGNGTCGHVVKMRHKPSDEIIAVKQMRRSGNSEENKRIIMDIEVVLKSHDCKYIVQCLGCFITDSEVWICMELMTTCFDKLLKRLGKPIPEEILGKVTVATVEALSYLKDKHGVIHRDVKPSNILLDTRGYVKLCDFGISGRLVDSMAKTRSAGCAAYLAPERIEPDPKNPDYDIRADVWSLGITLVELATGVFPYPDCNTDFEVLTKVIGQDPPSLPETFSPEFREFVKCCLIKDQKQRPKYAKLKNLPFIKKYESKNVDVGVWVVQALQQADKAASRTNTPQSSIRRFFTSYQRQPPAPHESPQQSMPIINGNPQNVYKPLMPENIKKSNEYSPLALPPADRNNGGGGGGGSGGGGHTSRLSLFQNINNQRDIKQPYQRIPDQPTTNNYHNYKTFSPFQAYQNHRTATTIKLQKDPVTVTSIPITTATCNLPDVVAADPKETAKYRSPLLLHRNLIVDDNGSPTPERRTGIDTRWRSPSASPLPLRSQFHQNSQEQQYNCGNTSPIILQRFYHQQKQQQLAKEAEESGKKRFASYIKLPLSGDRSGRSSRHQSPDPPPRLNRAISGDNQSPLALRRQFLETNAPCSPNLPKRYVSPTPPVPPPRRLSESTSVPGSPQHFRTRFHYTPEPHRRLFHNNDVS